MTETITESFCERCGTRYTFDSTATVRRGGIGRVRVLGRGLKNFIENDGLPMAEAMAAARDEEQRSGLTRQLDDFHKTFNFCMTCRQYTCPSCWNAKAGECLTCAPDLTREVLPAPFPDLPVEGPAAGNGHEVVEAAAWPRADLERMEAADAAMTAAAGAGAMSTEQPEPEPVVEAPDVIARLGAFVAVEPVDDLTADELSEVESALAAASVMPEPVAPALDEATPAEPTFADAADAVPDEALTAMPEVSLAAAAAIATSEPVAEATSVPEAADLDAASAALASPPAVDAVDAGRTQTRSLLGRFRPGRDAAVAAAAGAAATSGPVPAAEAEASAEASAEAAAGTPAEPGAELIASAALGMLAAAPEPEPRPVVVEAAPETVAEPEAVETAPETVAEPEVVVAPEVEAIPPVAPVEPVAAEPAPAAAAAPPPPVDVVGQPTWSKVAPSAPSTDEPPSWPEVPVTPPVPAPAPAAGASPWAARLAMSRPETSGVWAASNREVLGASPQAGAAPAAVQSCVSCGLSLSANARFCRRCGSRQG